MDYKFCPKCGQKLAMDAQFCPNCGTKQPIANAQQPQSTTVSMTTPKQASSQIIDQKKVNSHITAESSVTSETISVSEQQVTQQSVSENNTKTNVNNSNNDQAQSSQSDFYQPRNNKQFKQATNQKSSNYYDTWHPYNQSAKPGLVNSFKVWLHSFTNYKGCMGRADFWWGYLAFFLIYLVIVCIDLLADSNPSGLSKVLDAIVSIFATFYGIVSIYAIVERFHDTGHSGWNYWWCLTVIGLLYIFYLLILPTNLDEKRWVRKKD